MSQIVVHVNAISFEPNCQEKSDFKLFGSYRFPASVMKIPLCKIQKASTGGS